MDTQTNFDRQIFEVYNVHGYADIIGTVHLLVDDMAEGLGFVKAEEKVSTRNGRFSTTSGRKIYKSIRWARINKYLRDFGCLGNDDPDVKSGDYIPEQWFYFLAMKANNEAAKKFQRKVAYEIMPALRKNGYYSLTGETVPAVETAPAPAVKKLDVARVYLFQMSDGTVQIVKIGHSNNIRSRVAKIERETGLKVVDMYFTPEMPRKDARLVEWASQKKLAPQRVRGEFFSADFDEARAIIDYFVEITTTTLPPEYLNRIADKQI